NVRYHDAHIELQKPSFDIRLAYWRDRPATDICFINLTTRKQSLNARRHVASPRAGRLVAQARSANRPRGVGADTPVAPSGIDTTKMTLSGIHHLAILPS